MLKRLLWLSLFSLLFFLFLGLMAQPGSTAVPPRPIQTHYALMPAPQAQVKTEPYSAFDALASIDLHVNQAMPCPVQPLRTLAAKPYYEQSYHVFHLSDEAG